MKVQRTLTFKLYEPTDRKNYALKKTLRQFNNCVNKHIDGFRHERTQKELYEESKEQWTNLPTALIQTARDKAKESVKSSDDENGPSHDNHADSLNPIRYDQRILTLETRNGWLKVSIASVEGRVRLPVMAGEDHLDELRERDFDFQMADLIYRADDDEWFLHVTIARDVEIPSDDDFDVYVGVDLGLNNLAVCSAWTPSGNHLDSLFINGDEALNKRDHYHRVRRDMGQNNALDAIQPMKDNEYHYVEDVCHKVSRAIVDFADLFEGNVCVVFEKLDGIRETIDYSKQLNRQLHGWPFGKILDYTKYKLHEQEHAFRTVDPAGTSSHCSDCTSEVKARGRFLVQCVSCGTTRHRDWMASQNIVQRLWFYRNHDPGRSESGPERERADGGPMDARLVTESDDPPERLTEASCKPERS